MAPIIDPRFKKQSQAEALAEFDSPLLFEHAAVISVAKGWWQRSSPEINSTKFH